MKPRCGQSNVETLFGLVIVGLPLMVATLYFLQMIGLHVIGFMVLQSYSREALYSNCQLTQKHVLRHELRTHQFISMIPGYKFSYFQTDPKATSCKFSLFIMYDFPFLPYLLTERFINLHHKLSKPTGYSE